MVSPEPDAFIRAHTRLQRPPHAPEIQLQLADEITPIWRSTEEDLARVGVPPPFWAFAWAGGQALARYLLDNRERVRGLSVLDFASGSGLVAIAAKMAGAASVTANDIDPFCAAAVAVNARINGVEISFDGRDLLGADPPMVDLICAGDISYERLMAETARAWLARAHARGARVLMGDPGRSYFHTEGLARLADYNVTTTRELEDREVKRTGVWTFA